MDKFNSKEASETFTRIINSEEDGNYRFVLNGKVKIQSNGVKSHLNLRMELKNPIISIGAEKGAATFSIEDTQGNAINLITKSSFAKVLSKNSFWFVSDMTDEISIEFK